MGKETRERLVSWIGETVRQHYVGKVALVCLYGSHINGTANEKSDVDCYFVTKTQDGRALARTFLLEGVGYDLFPMSWERIEAIVGLEQAHQPLVGDVQVRLQIAEGGVQLHEYRTFSEFEQAQKESGIR